MLPNAVSIASIDDVCSMFSSVPYLAPRSEEYSATWTAVDLLPPPPAGCSCSPAVSAQAKFSLIDQATGEPEPSHVRGTTGSQEFTAKGFGFAKFIKRAWLDKSTCFKDDCFTIRCDVVVYKQIKHSVEERRVQSPSSSGVVVVPPSNLNSQIGDLLASKETADVTFQVGGEVFAAHRCILAARSPVFKAELFISEMKESRDTTVIRVDDMEAKVFGDLLCFIYTDMLPNNVPRMTRQEEVAMAQHLLVAADRYNLDRLKLICEEKLCKLMDVSCVATILTLAEQHNCHGLKKACFQFLGSPWTLNNAMATEGFEHLERSCTSVFKELFSKVSAL
ncbi:hypothetical protein PR202_ga00293 [Eleusine coracana subsp. coracana]|uniref:BTB domain-containing protein n=1 Tax=Eleusine coracana subsp. coracana TaxID=191504 RepID=A0AAV5BG41_ELECO|nr:hypothetical protein PR202_ga00293 [Eleusine coracana subsp. coracana]